MSIQLTGLFIHPVKGCRECSVSRAEVDAHGLVGDRRFMIVDETGKFLTQRTLPRLALIEAALSADTLMLSTSGHGSITVPLLGPSKIQNSKSKIAAPRVLPVTVWKDTVSADDCGAEPAAWLSAFLGQSCRLVRLGDAFARPIPAHKLPSTFGLLPSEALAKDGRLSTSPHVVSFADAFPFLLISEASLADLNARLDEPLPMNRFRPNLVVSGCDAYAEDGWNIFTIGALTFHAAGPCARCVVTTTDQLTAERGKEPLRTLAMYRRDTTEPTSVNFGQNLIHESKTGTLQVGDRVAVG